MRTIQWTLSSFFKRHGGIVVEVICFLFVVLFAYTGLVKLLGHERFVIVIFDSPLLTDFAGLLAWAVPIVELMVAVMLVIGRLRLLGLYASFSLMVIFTGYIIAILNFSEKIPCACGGVLEKMSWTQHLFFNIGLTLLALVGIVLYKSLKEQRKH
ncbi:MauE/DoxX family redox-associated membrane protein [Sinomicrobium oceani]|uniref:MauE/DoxX family redox-associated membrane protein n=1 Tax=Sinomicrobium oceani TaxID=1150368 RepID=UPI00227D1FA5|nr:MauE/DoxX family redox-associated membrane protein [Sinomicrobium oceani]